MEYLEKVKDKFLAFVSFNITSHLLKKLRNAMKLLRM